jgi:hypothetical protein
MDRVYGYALSAVLLVGVGAAVLECGSSASVCGNGVKEDGEQCDNGMTNGAAGNNCSTECKAVGIPRASLQVFYTRLKPSVGAYPNFPSPSCKDLGVSETKAAHVVLEGPTPKDEIWPCNMISGSYDGVEPGTYQSTVTLLDDAGNPVTKPVKSMMVDVKIGGAASNLMVTFAESDYLRTDYKGNFDFRLSWGQSGKLCADVGLTMEQLTLVRPGSSTPVTDLTKGGHKLDGTSYACFVKTPTMDYEEVPSLPWGHYDLYVNGTMGGAATFCQKFDVFVGIGVATPTYDLIVSPASTDGGACP